MLRCTLLVLLFSYSVVISNPGTSKESVEKLIANGLDYLEYIQIKEDLFPYHFRGEWPSHILNQYSIIFIGNKGESAYDANCFTTSMVHNLLAKMYLDNPDYESIPGMLDLSMQNILLFRDSLTFNFWHTLPPDGYFRSRRILRNPKRFTQTRPTHYYYHTRFLQKYTNIPDDADDTAASYVAMMNFNEIAGKYHFLQAVEMPDSLGHIFSKYRDKRRRNFSPYNRIWGHGKRTGAFMTWLDRESFYTPFNFLFPRQRKPNMPHRSNEVCCVVNAKVINLLDRNNETATPGFEDACSYINRMFENGHQKSCGVYYPTNFSLHVEVSFNLKHQIDCLQPSIPFMIADIKEAVNTDGFWESDLEDNDLQKTIYATLTLLNLKQSGVSGLDNLICSGVNYITANTSNTNGYTFWCGGIFFSSGTILRDSHVWVSDPVTTALAIKTLHLYKTLFFD